MSIEFLLNVELILLRKSFKASPESSSMAAGAAPRVCPIEDGARGYMWAFAAPHAGFLTLFNSF